MTTYQQIYGLALLILSMALLLTVISRKFSDKSIAIYGAVLAVFVLAYMAIILL